MVCAPLAIAGAFVLAAGCSGTMEGEDPTAKDSSRVQGSLENRLHPLLDCVDAPATPGGSFVAHFGYYKGTGTGFLPVGAANNFSPGAADRGQPTTFPPFAHHDVVQVAFDGTPLTWTLGAGSVTASSASNLCQSACPTEKWAHGYDTPLLGNIALDPAGNLFVTGGFAKTMDFGNGPLVTGGGSDVFVAKLDPATGLATYAVNYGDTEDQAGVGITADGAGHFAIVGTYTGTLNLGGAAPVLTSAVNSVFIAGFNALTGTALWARNVDLGGGSLTGIATDPTDNGVVVTGTTGSGAAADFGGGPLASGGGSDVVIAKLASANGTLLWAKQVGDSFNQIAQAVTVDASGTVYVTGQYSGALDFGNGPLPAATAAQKHIFVAGLNHTDGTGVKSRSFGAAGQQQSAAIAVDHTGNVIIGGSITGSVDFGTVVLKSAGGQDAFVAKLATDLSTVWAVSFGDTSTQTVKGVSVDRSGNVAATGFFQGVIAASPAGTLTSAGAFDAFALKLDANTGAPTCALDAGDVADQTAQSIVVDPATNGEYLLGTFLSSINWGAGALTSTSVTSQTYLVKLQ